MGQEDQNKGSHETEASVHSPAWLVILLLLFFPPLAWYLMWKHERYHSWFPFLVMVYGALMLVVSLVLAVVVVPRLGEVYREFNARFPVYSVVLSFVGVGLGLAQIAFGWFAWKRVKTRGAPARRLVLGSLVFLIFFYLVAGVFQGLSVLFVVSTLYNFPSGTEQDDLRSPSLSDTWQDTSIPPAYDAKRFLVQGDKVFDGSQLLFTNVVNVEEARIGPDGKTIHFKVVGHQNQARCANLESDIEEAGENYPSPPPSRPPWDYQRINHFATIKGCYGGYLKNSDAFAYLALSNEKEGLIVVEDFKSGRTITVPVDADLLWGFFDGTEKRGNSYWVRGVASQDGLLFYYPMVDATPIGRRLVMAFARLILTVDLNREIFMGGVALVRPEYSVIADSFWFLSQEGSPLVVVEAGWEGYVWLQALLDLSGEDLKVVNLHEYQKESVTGLLGIETVRWEGERLLFSFYEEIEVTDQADVDMETLEDLSAEMRRQEEMRVREELRKIGKYEDVYCSFEQSLIGYGYGCLAAVNLVNYSYTPGGDLTKL